MIEIYLIRHGECERSAPQNYNAEKKRPDQPLTEKGRTQALRLAQRLSDVRFDKAFCSDLIRAKETAEILNSAVSSEVVSSPALREIDMGGLHHLSWESYPELHARWVKHDEDIPYPDGENGETVWNRCRGTFEEIIAAGYNRVAIVAMAELSAPFSAVF